MNKFIPDFVKNEREQWVARKAMEMAAEHKTPSPETLVLVTELKTTQKYLVEMIKNCVTREEFLPVKLIAYGIVTVAMGILMTAMVMNVISNNKEEKLEDRLTETFEHILERKFNESFEIVE